MKKIIIACIVAISLHSITVSAQSAKIGIKTGVALTKVGGQFLNDQKWDDDKSLASIIENKPGLAAGIGINSMVSDYFWLKHEFMFVNKGYKATYENEDGSKSNVTERNYYFDAYPINFAVHLYGAQIFFGPAASVMINRSYKYKDENGADKTETGVDAAAAGNITSLIAGSEPFARKGSNFIQFDAGIVAGFEYEFDFGLNLGFRYVHGLMPLYEKSYNPKDIEAFYAGGKEPEKVKTQIYNRSMIFTLGYTLGREKK